MPQKQKINRAKVAAALDTPCPKCGHAITPADIRRVDFEHVVCPKCGERFTPGSGKCADKLCNKDGSFSASGAMDSAGKCWST